MTQPTRTERAQLLLITALALAVILVTVALLLNAAIFTENVATRDTTADGHEAIELRGELVTGIGDLIETENREGSGDSDTVENGIDAMEPMVDRERARHGTIATLRRTDTKNGKLVASDIDAGETDWTVVRDVDQARAFTLTVDPDTLYSNSDPNATQLENNSLGIEFSTAGDTVTQYVYNDSDHVVLAAVVGSGDPEMRCRIAHDNRDTTVDLTGDRLSTNASAVDCYRGLWPDNDPNEIAFMNADAASGLFTVTVDNSASVPAIDSDPAVYSVTVDIGYQSQDLTFETTARIAPGEPQ